MVDTAFFKNMISSAKQKAHTKEIMTKLREEENINEMREFLQAEQLILDNEVKLGDVIKGMADTVDAIIEETKTVYGHGVGVNNKIKIVRSQLPGKTIPEYNPELTKLLRIFGQAHEILKVLVNDHKKTESLELEYTHGMGEKKKASAKTKDPTLSYKTFMRIIDAFTHYSGNIKLHPEEYNPNVESIIEHIREGTTHAEKRDLILNKLKVTLLEIKATYEQMLQQDEATTIFFNKLLKDKTLSQEALTTINADGSAKYNNGIGLLIELEGRKKAIRNQLEVIKADIIKINQALGLEENIKKGFFFTRKAVEKYKEKEKKKANVA